MLYTPRYEDFVYSIFLFNEINHATLFTCKYCVVEHHGMIVDIYKNREGKLPSAPGRVWHEADINYNKGYRNRERILYSNDGLIFVTYDHYQTFYEMVK